MDSSFSLVLLAIVLRKYFKLFRILLRFECDVT